MKKKYLCVEHGETFIIQAKDIDTAHEEASVWGAQVVRELKKSEYDSYNPADGSYKIEH